jgi:serine/threonine protein phosphatase 1
VPLKRQLAHDMLFIREDFLDHPHGLPYRVVHGHTIVPEVVILPDRVAIDTGAYEGGPLSAVAMEGDTVRVLQVRP